MLSYAHSTTTDSSRDVDLEDRPRAAPGQHQANIDDITLRAAEDFTQYDLDDPLDIGPSDGIGSNDFNIDLGLDWGEVNRGHQDNSMDVDDSMEVPRDADFDRESIASHLLGNRDDIDADLLSHADPSENGFGGGMDIDAPDFTGIDLDDLGIGFGDQSHNHEKTPTRASTRAC